VLVRNLESTPWLVGRGRAVSISAMGRFSRKADTGQITDVGQVHKVTHAPQQMAPRNEPQVAHLRLSKARLGFP